MSMYALCNLPPEMSLDSAGFKPRSRPPLPPSSSSSSASSGSGPPAGAAGGSGAPGPSTSAAFPRRGLPSAGRDSHDRCLEELEKERSLLLAELEKEEKEKDWYYAQLQNLTKRIDSLPLTENVSRLFTWRSSVWAWKRSRKCEI
uniref:Adenomatous polyposis coli N-terminal dimerisation domain-containing protein n=1 Tax=Stegastes partitus TaxID=144197 RepID=A0A3B4Z4J7_9TELE